jgi:hypothetical protein
MRGMESALQGTLRHPTLVIESLTASQVQLNYRFYMGTRIGDKWRCSKVRSAGCICIDGVSDRQTEERKTNMADKVKVWYDPEGDFLEVTFANRAGYMRETAHDAVMERVDDCGNLIGFSILEVSRLAAGKPLEAELLPLNSANQ